MGWCIPREKPEEFGEDAFWRKDSKQLPPICGLSQDYWPDTALYGAMRYRWSVFGWRRRRAHAACRWLIVRREVQVGIRESSLIETVMR